MTAETPDPSAAPTSDSDPLRHHTHYGADAPRSSFMERLSEAVASGMGSVRFLIISTLVILAWMLSNHLLTFLNHAYHGLLNGSGFDPAPYILLNLVFSAVAFYTGALVIIAQKAQSRRDKLNEEAAAKHREELTNFQNKMLEEQTQLLKENTALTQEIKDLSTSVATLTQQLHDHLIRS